MAMFRDWLIRDGSVFLTLLGFLCAPAWGQVEQAEQSVMPVSRAEHGIPVDLSYRLREGFSWPTGYATGDHNLYYFLQMEEFVPHNTVWRAGPVKRYGEGGTR